MAGFLFNSNFIRTNAYYFFLHEENPVSPLGALFFLLQSVFFTPFFSKFRL
jgi:hypothetical protein